MKKKAKNTPFKKYAWIRFLKVLPDGWSSAYPTVDKVLKHLERKGKKESSRRLYLGGLYRLCTALGGIPPSELFSRDRVWLETQITNYLDKKQESKNYVNTCRNVIKKVLDINDITINFPKYHCPKRWRKRSEYIPTLKEALKMAQVGRSLRDRCIILFLIYSGLRNATLRALRISEVYNDYLIFNEYTIKKELDRDLEFLAVIVHPVMRKLVSDACKNDIVYFVFVPRVVVEALKDYLFERELKWGYVADLEPLFILDRTSKHKKTPLQLVMTENTVLEAIKEAAKAAGLKDWKAVTALSLRKVFDNFMINQEHRPLEIEQREFFMGHIIEGCRDAYFDKTKIEEMRGKYSKLNFDPKSIKMKVKKIITEQEFEQCIKGIGCEFITVLPSGKILVELEERALKPVTSLINNNKTKKLFYWNVTKQQEQR